MFQVLLTTWTLWRQQDKCRQSRKLFLRTIENCVRKKIYLRAWRQKLCRWINQLTISVKRNLKRLEVCKVFKGTFLSLEIMLFLIQLICRQKIAIQAECNSVQYLVRWWKNKRRTIYERLLEFWKEGLFKNYFLKLYFKKCGKYIVLLQFNVIGVMLGFLFMIVNVSVTSSRKASTQTPNTGAEPSYLQRFCCLEVGLGSVEIQMQMENTCYQYINKAIRSFGNSLIQKWYQALFAI